MRQLVLKPSNNFTKPFLFDNIFDDFFDNSLTNEYQNNYSPRVDISETNNSFDFNIAVPGLDKNDLSVDIEKGQLKISGERKFNDEKNNYHSIENGYGKFSRSFQLPEDIIEEKISASHKNGMLIVSIPKDAKSSIKKTITIK
jgi:HSP20 family protein